jgi:hypothetical protein
VAKTLVTEDVPSKAPEAAAVAADAVSPTAARARTWASAFIAAWLCFQIALPASYYFSADPLEERFAWRMFSDIHAAQRHCALTVSEVFAPQGSARAPVVREVDLARTVHPTWETYLRRNRRMVIDEFVAWRCARTPGVTAIDVRRACPVDSESRVPSSQQSLPCTAVPR